MASILQVEQIQGPTSGANANTITIPSGQTLDMSNATVNGALTEMPAGSVIQTVQSSKYTQFGSTSTSFVDTGLSVQITPTSANSKILITFCGGIRTINSSGNDCQTWTGITRDSGSTYVGQHFHRHIDYGGGGMVHDWTSYMDGLDEPNTTSQITYRLYMKLGNVGNNFELNPATGTYVRSTMTAMEIAG